MALIDEVATYLAAQGIGTVASTIFKSYLPSDPDACLTVMDTGGVQPDPDLPLREPTFQVLIRNTNYTAGKAKLEAVRTALHQQANLQLIANGTYIYYILAISEGGHLGRDDLGRDLFSINFQCKTR